jgi:hypothetical protein
MGGGHGLAFPLTLGGRTANGIITPNSTMAAVTGKGGGIGEQQIQIIVSGFSPFKIYSPSPEYPVACYRDEWRGEPRRSSLERRRVGFGAIPLLIPRSLLRGASFSSCKDPAGYFLGMIGLGKHSCYYTWHQNS